MWPFNRPRTTNQITVLKMVSSWRDSDETLKRLWRDLQETYKRLTRDFEETLKRLWIDFEETLKRLWRDFEETMQRLWGDFRETLKRLWTINYCLPNKKYHPTYTVLILYGRGFKIQECRKNVQYGSWLIPYQGQQMQFKTGCTRNK